MGDKSDRKKELSTTGLAKELNISPQELFQRLSDKGLLSRKENSWELTVFGQSKGDRYKQHEKYGRFVIWPVSMIADLESTHENIEQGLITATMIGKSFEISSTRINLILSELGWLSKNIKGWQITELGKRLGGAQSKDRVSGIPYVRWPASIIGNNMLITRVREVKGGTSPSAEDKPESITTGDLEFRDKFEAKLRATDGDCRKSPLWRTVKIRRTHT